MKEEYVNAYNSKQIIDTLLSQVNALLDLMMCSESDTSHESIKVACDMCLSMTSDLLTETDKLYNIARINSEDNKDGE